MPRKKISPIDWGYKHTKKFKDKKEELGSMSVISKIDNYLKHCSLSDYSVGHWTILKHITLAYCLNPFGIILKNNNFKNTKYLDLFCGAGITPIRETEKSKEEWIIGSPIIGTQMTDYPFSQYYFNDNNQRSLDLTEEILKEYNSKRGIPINYSLSKNDANVVIKQLIPDIENNYVFAFIDPAGFQWNWESMEELFKISVFDILLNFQTRQVNRVPDGKIQDFFGPCAKNVDSCSDCDEKLKLYINQIEGLGLKVIPIRIGMDNTDQYYYHLLHISRRDTYQNIILDVKNKIECFNGSSIKTIWNDLHSHLKQTSLEVE